MDDEATIHYFLVMTFNEAQNLLASLLIRVYTNIITRNKSKSFRISYTKYGVLHFTSDHEVSLYIYVVLEASKHERIFQIMFTSTTYRKK